MENSLSFDRSIKLLGEAGKQKSYLIVDKLIGVRTIYKHLQFGLVPAEHTELHVMQIFVSCDSGQ